MIFHPFRCKISHCPDIAHFSLTLTSVLRLKSNILMKKMIGTLLSDSSGAEKLEISRKKAVGFCMNIVAESNKLMGRDSTS